MDYVWQANEDQPPVYEVYSPGMLLAWRVGELLLVYRSVQVRDHHRLFKRILDKVGARQPVRSRIVTDPNMVLGLAEEMAYSMVEMIRLPMTLQCTEILTVGGKV